MRRESKIRQGRHHTGSKYGRRKKGTFFTSLLAIIGLLAASYGIHEVNEQQLPSEEYVNGADIGILEVHFLDVGQGDATLIKCGGQAMLIDTAEDDKGTAIQYYLMNQGVEDVDYLILTHPDSDHIGSADVIVTKYEIDHILMTDYEKDNRTYRRMMEAMQYKVVKPEIVRADAAYGENAGQAGENARQSEYAWRAGDTFTLGSAVCTIVAPVDTYDDPNNASIALLIEHGENSFLFTGDAEKEAEKDILENCILSGISLQADVYKAGHHGSSTSSCEELLDMVSPQYTVISCGLDNSYGHPHEETMERFDERGIQVYRTDEQGSIVAVSDGTQITWKTTQ